MRLMEVQRGVDLKRVQTWLGHKRIETTLIYAKLGTGTSTFALTSSETC